MPKLKTHKGALKRFKKTGRGKILRQQAYVRHLLGGKPRKRKRHLRGTTLVKGVDEREVKRLLPYWKKM